MLLVSASLYNSAMPLTTEEAAVTRVLADYYSAFSTLDVHAVLPYFHEPALLIGPGGMLPAPTRDVLPVAFTPVIEGLRATGSAEVS
jgi:ketosteroid isomerase-like protein